MPRTASLAKALLGASLLAPGCAKDPDGTGVPCAQAATGKSGPPNIVVFLADDVGVDMIDAWGPDTPGITPVFDQLAAESVRFKAAYAAPVCTPTRAELLTGRYSHRYGLTAVQPYHSPTPGLPDSEVTLAEALDEAGYCSAVVGKWHLGTASQHGTRHSLVAGGFHTHRGAVGNLDYVGSSDGSDQSFFHWEKSIDGELGWVDTYATTDNADEAIALIAEMPEPWLLYLPFFAAHEPFHVPPPDLHSGNLAQNAPLAQLYVADLEAMDQEMGRVLAALDGHPNTYVIFAGDNGTPGPIVPEPAKKSAYEAGVHVPMTIRGPGIEPRDVHHLTHVVDVFPTVLELAGLTWEDLALDGRSLVPALHDPNAPAHHQTVYAGRARPPHDPNPYVVSRMLRDTDWKLIERLDEGVWRTEFYDMRGRQVEDRDLLKAGPLEAEAQAAWDALSAEYDELMAGQPRP